MNSDLLDDIKQKMAKVLEVLRTDLVTVRTGKATPAIVENIVINAYGGTQRLKVLELATISITDPQTITITPFDQSIIGEIHKGILEANIGLTPSINADVIRIAIPPLSEERRQQLIHLMHQKLENGHVMARQVRHEAMNEIKKIQNDISEDEVERLEKEIQRLTDEIIAEIDSLGKRKEEELLQI